MGLNCGIVGLPNVGKSTLFSALTKAKAEAANYPFCTIDPNVGVVAIPDVRLTKIAEIIGSKEVIPTAMEFVDIAGLVRGASKGEGKGNAFLSDIRETHAILHVVRCFDDSDIVHVDGSVDPLRDIDVISTELLIADLESVERRVQKLEKQIKGGKTPALELEYGIVKKVHEALDAGKPARVVVPDKNEYPFYKSMHLLTSKPVLYVCNVNEKDFSAGGNEWVKTVKEKALSEGNDAVMISGRLEAEIGELPLEDQKEFLESIGAEEPGLNRLIQEAYSLLGLITYFTAGPKEARAWTIKKGTKAPEAAGEIHSDIKRGFIRAETYTCEDLFNFKTEAALKEAGLIRSEGKEYIVKDGDVLYFRHNV